MSELREIDEAQQRKWAMLGHEPIYARGSVRLAEFKKNFPRDLPVTVFDKDAETYRPVILSNGKPLLAGDVLPERADLALDERGRVLSQGEFERNYEQYLDAFVYPAGSDPHYEPVPNVVNYIKETPDTFSSSRGMVEIGFDPKLNAPFRPNQRYGPNGETEEEWKREQAKQSSDTTAILKQLAETQALLLAMVAKQNGQPLPEPTPEPAADVAVQVEAMSTAEAIEATADNDRERAPCGKYVTRGYIKQHMRHCADDACGDGSVNSEKE